jgi:hypothetical protein
MSRNNHVRPDRVQERRQGAAERQEAYDKLSTPEKLSRALTRGHAGTPEARRLTKLLKQGETLKAAA